MNELEELELLVIDEDLAEASCFGWRKDRDCDNPPTWLCRHLCCNSSIMFCAECREQTLLFVKRMGLVGCSFCGADPCPPPVWTPA